MARSPIGHLGSRLLPQGNALAQMRRTFLPLAEGE
jgi:hypothetical protein